MRLFLHSLIGKAKDWYLDQLVQIMTNWNSLEEKFLSRFFPHKNFMMPKQLLPYFLKVQHKHFMKHESITRPCYVNVQIMVSMILHRFIFICMGDLRQKGMQRT